MQYEYVWEECSVADREITKALRQEYDHFPCLRSSKEASFDEAV